ncbi:MAG TPA: CBS domain-containing protein [Desulfobacterales bacterium]|nr:CBS domain-containing protein [Desulfobacterales bacterium]
MLRYKTIEIFTSEEARWHGRALYGAVVEYVNDLKIAARTIVTRGFEGSYENGEVATGRLEALSYNMPLSITIIMPASELDLVLATIEDMVGDGIIAVRDLDVVSHKTQGLLMPRYMRVREIMTPSPQTAAVNTPLGEVARLLLSASFTGLPVVDKDNRPIGVIAQGDLIYKAKMPMRLGLLAQCGKEKTSAALEALNTRTAGEIMTQPPIVIEQDKLVTEAVNLMIAKKVKRLPVIDTAGKLVGILSRVDVFHTITKKCPDWSGFQGQDIQVENLRFVSDIVRRDTAAYTVLPDTAVSEVMQVIDSNDIQRVCVVDKDGFLLGIISDRDLLIAFIDRHPGIWDYFVSGLSFTERGRRHKKLREHLQANTAADVMNREITTIREDAPIEEAIKIMLDKVIKHLPVLDAEGKFKGLISRDSLLHWGLVSG